MKPLPEVGPELEQVATNVVVLPVKQLVVTHPLPALGNAATHEATGAGPVLTGVQVVWVKKLAAVLATGVHEAAPEATELFVAQVVATNPLPAEAGTGVQAYTGANVVVTTAQLRARNGDVVPGLVVQVATGVGPVTIVLQVVVLKPLPAVGAIGVQVARGVVLVVTGQAVVVQPLPAVAALGVHDDTLGVLVLLGVHTVDIKLLPGAAPNAVQVATGTGPLSVAVAQVRVIHPLPAAPVCGAHVTVAVGPELLVEHVRVTQLLPAAAVCGVQLATPVGPVVTVLQKVCRPFTIPGVQVATPTTAVAGLVQVVVTNPLPAVGPEGVQAATAVVLMATGVQVTVVKPLPALGACAEQVATGVAAVLLVEHVVAVQPLPALAADGVQLATPVGAVLFGVQVVAVQLFATFAGEGLQAATPVGAVLFGVQMVLTNPGPAPVAGVQLLTPAGALSTTVVQVRDSQLLPEPAVWGVQVATAVAGLVLVLQVVVTNPLPALGLVAVQLAGLTNVGPVLFDEQVVVVKLLPAVGPDAVQDAVPVGPVLLLPQVMVSPATGPDGVQPPGATGVDVTTGAPPALQVVVVQLLPAAAVLGAHAGSATGPVVKGAHVVVTLATTPAAQDAGDTAVGPVFTVLQVVVCAPTVPAAQDAAATGPLTTTSAHVTDVNELAAVAAAGVQDATAVGPVVWVVQNLPAGQLAAAISPSPSS
jgi:hypothetical protein